MNLNNIHNKSSENMTEIPDKSVDLIVTSPPYNIAVKYGNKWKDRKIVESKGNKYEDNLPEDEYRNLLKNVIQDCKRTLKDNGQFWLNIKNRYIDKQIVPPFWIMEFFGDMFLKNVVIWSFDWGGSTSKRFAPRYEYFFFFTKNNEKYTFNLDEVKIPALNYRPDRYKSQLKNPSDVWKFSIVSGNAVERTEHPAQFPELLIERIVRVGSNPNDVVLDPFMGSGTVASVAQKLNRNYLGYETNSDYIEIAEKRLKESTNQEQLAFFSYGN